MGNRRGLGDFLRTRRARVTPESVGLRSGSRRRVPGLRREELAQLAGISVEYYQRLEQGRATRPSEEVLDAVTRVLGLDEVERVHLNALARPQRRGAVPPTDYARRAVRPELQRMLNLMDRIPALVINDCFDVLATNKLAADLLLAPFTSAQPGTRNLARDLFLDPRARDFYVEWDDVAAATAGQLRLTAGHHPDDQDLAALLAELTTGSDAFHSLWTAGDVEQPSAGAKGLRHPDLGVLRLHYQKFTSLDDTRQRLITFIPEAQSPSEAALQLLATWAGRATDRVPRPPVRLVTGLAGPG